MKTFFVLFLTLLAVFSTSVLCEDSDVVVGDSDNFESLIEDNEFVLVEFYAPWCGHCKKLAPEYEKAATAVKEDGIVLVKIDATVESELASSHGIQGYPTLKFYRSGNEVEYDGPRDAAGIEKWLKKKTGPAAVTLDSKEALTTFTEQEGSQIVGFFEEDSDDHKAFLELAVTSEVSDFDFGVVLGDAVSTLEGEVGQVKIFREGQETLTESFDEDKTGDWIVSKGYPLVDELGQSVFQRAQKLKRPLVAAFFEESDDDLSGHKEALLNVASELEGQVVFCQTVSGQYMSMASQWGASGDNFPTVIFVDLRPESQGARPKAFNEENEFSESELKSFFDGCLEGTEEGFRKSEPIPESNDGPVTVVVGKNFEDVVYTDKADVLVEFYAPWCGHCKKLAPIYDEVGEVFQDIPEVVVAKCDATANGFPAGIDVRGFPTLVYFKAGDKTPVPYNGDRTKKGIVEFLKENSSFDVDVPEVEDEGDDKDEL